MQKDSKGRFHSYFELVSFLTTVRKVRLQASFVRHCPMTDNYLQPWVWSGPLVTGRRSRLLFFKTFHWHRSRSLCSLRLSYYTEPGFNEMLKVLLIFLWFCIATLCDWLKNLVPLSQPITNINQRVLSALIGSLFASYADILTC